MWQAIKEEIMKKTIEELHCHCNWEMFRKYFTDESIDEYLIFPLLKKLNSHLKSYIIMFFGTHTLIILLLILIIVLILYKK